MTEKRHENLKKTPTGKMQKAKNTELQNKITSEKVDINNSVQDFSWSKTLLQNTFIVITVAINWAPYIFFFLYKLFLFLSFRFFLFYISDDIYVS